MRLAKGTTEAYLMKSLHASADPLAEELQVCDISGCVVESFLVRFVSIPIHASPLFLCNPLLIMHECVLLHFS